MPDRPAPPPLTRFQEGWRLAVAALGGLALWVGQFGTNGAVVGWFGVVDLLVGAGCVVLAHHRRRWPVLVAWVTTLATAVSATAGVAGALAYVSLVTTRRWRPIVGVSLVGLAAGHLYEYVPAPGRGTAGLPWWTSLIFLTLATGIALVAGLYIGARRDLVQSYRERAETAEREQAARVEQARMGERARIAREMHDVLAHRISLVALHAGAMTYRTDLGAEELRSSAAVVQENAHLALGELRDVLGVLRDPAPAPATTGPAPAPPQPTLADLAALVRETRQAGSPVQVVDHREPGTVPDAVGRTAYRVVQEALTNVRKHAPGGPAVLRLAGGPGGRLEVEVTNPLRRSPVPVADRSPARPPAAVPGGGVGLVGLAERVGLAGGDLAHGPDGGRYRVRASLPWPA
ncbi:histidine kinase [Microlunatus capsulatus]|uniref:histidine kinase n=1 Tax=Microlunatus capsulatus TaxID=99117 RepID=UPI0031DD65D4